MLIGSLENAYDIFMRAREKHGPVIFPTDTIYGIGAPLSDREANKKIYDIKGREKNKPFPVLISSYAQAESLAHITDAQRKIMNKLWPGTYTLIVKARENVEQLYTQNGNIAIRMPADKWLSELIEQTGPLSATSANLSGHAYSGDISDIIRCFHNHVDFFITMRTYALNSSTIIDLSGDTPVIIRGEINLHEILS